MKVNYFKVSYQEITPKAKVTVFFSKIAGFLTIENGNLILSNEIAPAWK